MDFYGVYHISPHGELEVVAKPKGRPNGIALSPNGRILYVSNSDEHNLRAYDLDHNGAASNERVFVSGIDGVPNGIRVDEKGNLYLAANKIEVYSPRASRWARSNWRRLHRIAPSATRISKGFTSLRARRCIVCG